MKLPVFEQNRAGQRKPEFITWAALCLALEIKSYVELGTGHAHFMKAMGVEKVASVDIAHPGAPAFIEGVRYSQGDSHDPTTLTDILNYLGDRPDAVFIDADHDYEPVKKDFELWWPEAKIVVGFHDILIPSVAQFWQEMSPNMSSGSAKIIGVDIASALSWQGPTAPQDGILSGGGIGVVFK